MTRAARYRSPSAVLNYFDHYMQVSDRIAVEDGIVADLEGDNHHLYNDGPNRAIAEFLGKVAIALRYWY